MAVVPDDANLFTGDDPADGTKSAQIPAGGGTYIDWDDLKANVLNHRLLDLNNPDTARDDSSFPRSNECVSDSKVLSKMDLTYVAAANNKDYAYFAVQRANNNGDAGYYWVFTKKTPSLAEDLNECKAGEGRLMYDISVGDVLLSGHFKPSSEALLRAFVAVDNRLVTAVEAINFQDGTLWNEQASAVEAVAINTTDTDAGGFGNAGVKASSGVNVEEEIFAESAVKTSIFTGSSGICGATFYGSVITRSSGSGGTTPDLKDLAGPRQFNFGEVSVTASLTETCTTAMKYNATLKGIDGQPVANATCDWDCDGVKFSGCSGQKDMTPGNYTCKVTVTDPGTGCGKTEENLSIRVCDDLGVTADLDGSCTMKFDYDALPTGGCSSGLTYGWKFSGPEAVSDSATKSGNVNVTTAGSYSGTVTVTEKRNAALSCTAKHTDSAAVYKPVTVSLKPSTQLMSCSPDMATDAVTYTAMAAGGVGSYSYAWTIDQQGYSCSGSSCTINPADSDFCTDVNLSVRVTDSQCGSKDSETETYHKETKVTATDNP